MNPEMPCDCSWCNPAKANSDYRKKRDKRDSIIAGKEIVCLFTLYSEAWNPEDGDKYYKSYGTILKKCQCPDCIKEKKYLEGLK
jgi:hypothetical protein